MSGGCGAANEETRAPARGGSGAGGDAPHAAAFDAVVRPQALAGGVDAIASKSAAHRALVMAAVSDAPVRVACATTSRDIEATCSCLRALGAQVERQDGALMVRPVPRGQDGLLDASLRGAHLDCDESGSTLRFMLAVSCALGARASLGGGGRLPQRPNGPLARALREHGCTVSGPGEWPVRTSGALTGGDFRLPGTLSSQFASGLMLAGVASGAGARVEVEPPVGSRPYVDLTARVMAGFGVDARVEDLPGGGVLATVPAAGLPHAPGGAFSVEGDWSNAAFWLCAGALGDRPVTVRGLDMGSEQGDRAVCDILRALGAQVGCDGPVGSATARAGDLRGAVVDVGDVPDLAVPLAVVAACAHGTTRLVNAGRLRAKESDRLESVAAMLDALGVSATVGDDSLEVVGVGDGPLRGGCAVDSCNDHRIAMAASIAACRADGPVTVCGADAVRKSYPGFYDDLAALGGVALIVPSGDGHAGAGHGGR